MPTYTYRCTNCEHQFEARQRMMDDPLTECPECEGKVRRVVNSVGLVFKGHGFYVTLPTGTFDLVFEYQSIALEILPQQSCNKRTENTL